MLTKLNLQLAAKYVRNNVSSIRAASVLGALDEATSEYGLTSLEATEVLNAVTDENGNLLPE